MVQSLELSSRNAILTEFCCNTTIFNSQAQFNWMAILNCCGMTAILYLYKSSLKTINSQNCLHLCPLCWHTTKTQFWLYKPVTGRATAIQPFRTFHWNGPFNTTTKTRNIQLSEWNHSYIVLQTTIVPLSLSLQSCTCFHSGIRFTFYLRAQSNAWFSKHIFQYKTSLKRNRTFN